MTMLRLASVPRLSKPVLLTLIAGIGLLVLVFNSRCVTRFRTTQRIGTAISCGRHGRRSAKGGAEI